MKQYDIINHIIDSGLLSNLSGRATKFLFGLVRHVDSRGKCFPASDLLEKETGVAKAHHWLIRIELENSGIITIPERGKGAKSCLYQFHLGIPQNDGHPLNDGDAQNGDTVSPNLAIGIPQNGDTVSPKSVYQSTQGSNQLSTHPSTHSGERVGLDGFDLVWKAYKPTRRGKRREVESYWRENDLESRADEILQRLKRWQACPEWKERNRVVGLIRFLEELVDVDPEAEGDGSGDYNTSQEQYLRMRADAGFEENDPTSEVADREHRMLGLYERKDGEYKITPDQHAMLDDAATQRAEREIDNVLFAHGVKGKSATWKLAEHGATALHVKLVALAVESNKGIANKPAEIGARLKGERTGLREWEKITAKAIGTLEPLPTYNGVQVQGWQPGKLCLVDGADVLESNIKPELVRIHPNARWFEPTNKNIPPGHELRFRADTGEAYHAPINNGRRSSTSFDDAMAKRACPSPAPIRPSPNRAQTEPQPIGDVTAVDAELAARVDRIANAPIDELKAELTTDSTPKRIMRPKLSDLMEAGAA